MKIAIYPGSFDPVTSGHLNIIRRAADIFDKLIVCVMVNSTKTPMFTREERVALIQRVTTDIPNVEVDSSSSGRVACPIAVRDWNFFSSSCFRLGPIPGILSSSE